MQRALKARSFWFHYNKPEAARAGHPVMTVHYAGKCHLVRSISIEVPTETRERNTQPRMVIAGKGFVTFEGDHAHIRGTNE